MSIIVYEDGAPPITDSHGVKWVKTEMGLVTADGKDISDGEVTVQLVYADDVIWRQVQNRYWFYRGGGKWLPTCGTPVSPVARSTEIQGALRDILGHLDRLQKELAEFKASSQTFQSMIEGLALSSLAQMAATTAANQMTVVDLMNRIITSQMLNQNALLAMLGDIPGILTSPIETDKLVVDTAHSTEVPQKKPVTGA